MGKHYCKIEHKWCKHIQHRNFCNKGNSELKFISRCPRLFEIETKRLSDLLKVVDFDDVFYKLCYLFSSEKDSKEGYKNVFNKLILMTPQKHKLSDLFICVDKIKYNDEVYLDVSGKNLITEKYYGIEFCPWIKWISMFITQETLNNLTKEEIIAACLYEMTFFGFTEDRIADKKLEFEKIIKNINKNETKR